mgnify:CR=1 FL=1|jgi:hypothetical protein
MEMIAYWFPAAMCCALVVLAWIVDRRITDLSAAIVELEALKIRVEMATSGMDERAADFAEAIALANYGAREEAIEKLRKWAM